MIHLKELEALNIQEGNVLQSLSTHVKTGIFKFTLRGPCVTSTEFQEQGNLA